MTWTFLPLLFGMRALLRPHAHPSLWDAHPNAGPLPLVAIAHRRMASIPVTAGPDGQWQPSTGLASRHQGAEALVRMLAHDKDPYTTSGAFDTLHSDLSRVMGAHRPSDPPSGVAWITPDAQFTLFHPHALPPLAVPSPLPQDVGACAHTAVAQHLSELPADRQAGLRILAIVTPHL